jgi:hypothetical protein
MARGAGRSGPRWSGRRGLEPAPFEAEALGYFFRINPISRAIRFTFDPVLSFERFVVLHSRSVARQALGIGIRKRRARLHQLVEPARLTWLLMPGRKAGVVSAYTATIGAHCWRHMTVPQSVCVCVLSGMSKDGKIIALAATTLLLSSLSLGGCASTAGSSPMDARAEAPARPKTSGYPAVEDVPPRRGPAMTADEQLKLQKELTAARDRQASRARGHAASPNP